MKSVLVIVVFGVCWFLTESASQHCDFPPALWCSSRKIARACQVERQCEANVWSRSKSAAEAVPAPAVNFTVYLEFLCPFCKLYFKTQLSPTFQKISSIMNLELVPYGYTVETKVGDKWIFNCTHGSQECLGNLIETCSIHILGNMSSAFPFVDCLEESDLDPNVSAPQCAKQLGIDYGVISDCVNGPLGNQLEHEMGVKTESLRPHFTHVPWILLNGVHTAEIEQRAKKDLLGLICDTYTGIKPDACKKEVAD